MDTLTFWLVAAAAGLIILLVGGMVGFLLAAKRFYNDGYRDGFTDGETHEVAMSGECGDCGWEASYSDVASMIKQILEHSNVCPAKRY